MCCHLSLPSTYGLLCVRKINLIFPVSVSRSEVQNSNHVGGGMLLDRCLKGLVSIDEHAATELPIIKENIPRLP